MSISSTNLNVPSANITDNTNSTSTSTGALVITGGLGIGGSTYSNNISNTVPNYGSLFISSKSIPNNALTNFYTSATGQVSFLSGIITQLTNSLRSQQTGIFNITSRVIFDSNATGVRYLILSLSTSDISTLIQSPTISAVSGSETSIYYSITLRMTGSSTVSLSVFQNSGGNLNITNSYLTLTRVN